MENIPIDNPTANEQLFAIMKKATSEAEANGLTAEQLDELLKDESQVSGTGYENKTSEITRLG